MREKMAIFQVRNSVWRDTQIFNGGDVDENRQFIERKMVAHYHQDVMGAMLMKIVILLKEKWSHITKI